MDTIALQIAATLLVLIGAVHSILGEKYILIRLFRRDNLPKLFGDDWFTRQTLRFAWHLTTVAWWGFATILYFLSHPGNDVRAAIVLSIAVVFVISGGVALLFSRGKHLSWLVFFSIALACVYGAYPS